MAKPQFTLAALATQALPGISFTNTFPVHSDSNYFSAVLRDELGRGYVVQLPKNTAAETLLAEEMIALNALDKELRDELPFEVPSFLGQAPYGKTRAVIFSEVPGVVVTNRMLDATIAYRIGEAIGRIHTIPTSVVTDAGLASASSSESRELVSEILNKVSDFGKAPSDLISRWSRAVDDSSLWSFTPTVILGSLAADSFKLLDGKVSAVSGWAGLQIGDPAFDLKWLLAGIPNSIAQVALERYSEVTALDFSPAFKNRILLYAELELARWLIHGIDNEDEAIIGDALDMLRSLAEQIEPEQQEPEASATREIPVIHEEVEVTEIPEEDEFSFQSSSTWSAPTSEPSIPEPAAVTAEIEVQGESFFDDSALAAQLENESQHIFGSSEQFSDSGQSSDQDPDISGETEQISLDFIDSLQMADETNHEDSDGFGDLPAFLTDESSDASESDSSDFDKKSEDDSPTNPEQPW